MFEETFGPSLARDKMNPSSNTGLFAVRVLVQVKIWSVLWPHSTLVCTYVSLVTEIFKEPAKHVVHKFSLTHLVKEYLHEGLTPTHDMQAHVCSIAYILMI